MSVIDDTPSTKDFLSPVNFKLLMKRAPNLEWFIQSVNLPGITTTPAKEPSPFMGRYLAGGPIEHENLRINFKVSEDLSNFLEIYHWLMAINWSTDLKGYEYFASLPDWTNKGVSSDIIITILNASKIPKFEIYFHDAFPINIGSIQFDASSDSVDYPRVDAEFTYSYYEVNKII